MTLIKKIKDKKVNFEFNKEYIKVVTDKIYDNDASFITKSFEEMHPADAADIIEHLSQNDRENLIKLNNFNINPEVFVELNESIQTEIIKYLSKDSIVYILKNSYPFHFPKPTTLTVLELNFFEYLNKISILSFGFISINSGHSTIFIRSSIFSNIPNSIMSL